MSANLNQGSAKIYQFPAGGRAALGGRRYGEDKPDLAASSPVASAADCCESWYHQAAIQEAKPTWEH